MWNRRNTYVDKIIMKKCYKCNSVKPPHAHHCPNCGNCVAYMDHHCPWVNNCVGLYTQKLFVLFNFYTLSGKILNPQLYFSFNLRPHYQSLLWTLKAEKLQWSRKNEDGGVLASSLHFRMCCFWAFHSRSIL
jgi:hypothetical protein